MGRGPLLGNGDMTQEDIFKGSRDRDKNRTFVFFFFKFVFFNVIDFDHRI